MIRVGHGFDAHALVSGRRLMIGGVEIPFTVGGQAMGLLGHSDADVLLHAITDALLGAAGLGDIGQLFPDHEVQYKDADSLQLLRGAVAKVHAAGWRVGNVDATVIAQQPRIAPYVAAMRAQIAPALGVDESAVSIKGKTTEHLGWTGRGEGIAAQALALLMRD